MSVFRPVDLISIVEIAEGVEATAEQRIAFANTFATLIGPETAVGLQDINEGYGWPAVSLPENAMASR